MLRYDLNFYGTTLTTKGARIALRAKVNDTLLTGITAIDALLPIGRGQRQLILGDR
jgi:F-type H+-transporting ATPase subunit alpha